MESTKEYISSSSGSSMHTRTTTLGFTITREDLGTIKEKSNSGLCFNDFKLHEIVYCTAEIVSSLV